MTGEHRVGLGERPEIHRVYMVKRLIGESGRDLFSFIRFDRRRPAYGLQRWRFNDYWKSVKIVRMLKFEVWYDRRTSDTIFVRKLVLIQHESLFSLSYSM